MLFTFSSFYLLFHFYSFSQLHSKTKQKASSALLWKPVFLSWDVPLCVTFPCCKSSLGRLISFFSSLLLFLVCVFSFLFTYHPLNCKWGGKMQALLLLAWVQIPTSCLFECAEWLTFCVLILILERQMTGAHFLEVFPRAKKKKSTTRFFVYEKEDSQTTIFYFCACQQMSASLWHTVPPRGWESLGKLVWKKLALNLLKCSCGHLALWVSHWFQMGNWNLIPTV